MSSISNPIIGGATGGNEDLAETLLLGDVTGLSSGIFFSAGDNATLSSTSELVWTTTTNPFGAQDAGIVRSGVASLQLTDGANGLGGLISSGMFTGSQTNLELNAGTRDVNIKGQSITLEHDLNKPIVLGRGDNNFLYPTAGVVTFARSSGLGAGTAGGILVDDVQLSDLRNGSATLRLDDNGTGQPRILLNSGGIITWTNNVGVAAGSEPVLSRGGDDTLRLTGDGTRFGDGGILQIPHRDDNPSTNLSGMRIFTQTSSVDADSSEAVFKMQTGGTDWRVHHSGVVTTDVSGATVTLSNIIPQGSFVLGVVTRVNVALGTGSGTTGYALGTPGDANLWGDIVGTSVGTSSNHEDFTAAGAVAFYPTTEDIVLTAAGGSFNGTGDIRVVISYMRVTAPIF